MVWYRGHATSAAGRRKETLLLWDNSSKSLPPLLTVNKVGETQPR